MKNILFQKIPIDEKGIPILTVEEILNYHNYVKENIPQDYILITSAMDLQKVDGDAKIISIDMKSYSANELREIIEKAWMYDECGK